MKREIAVLKRLGPVPFWRGEKKCLAELEDIYRRAIDAAIERQEKLCYNTQYEIT